MNKLKLITLIGFVWLSFSARADEMYQGPWYVLPGISYNVNDNSLHANDNISGSIRVGKEFNKSFDFQVGATYASGGSYKQTLLQADALYFFSRDNLRPFVLAGVGYAQNKTSVNAVSTSKDSWMGDIGVGVQYLVDESLGFQVDLRGIMSQAEVADGLGNPSTKTVTSTAFGFSGIYRFGVPKTKAVVAEIPVAKSAVSDAVKSEEKSVPPQIQDKFNEAAKLAAESKKDEDACKPTLASVEIQEEALFEYKKTAIEVKNQPILDRFISAVKGYEEVDVLVVAGHADRIGSQKYNQKLSEERAISVKNYLISHGINNTRITSLGKGKSEPVVACEGIKGKAKLIDCLAPNRRVVIEAKGKEAKACDIGK